VPESADGDEGPDSAYSKSLNLLLVRIANSIDKALNISMGRGNACNDQHVFRIVVVRGKAFYGYHPEEEEFLKIYLFNPNTSKKLAELLLAGAIMNRSFQPHETHIPFLLQFFIDYNLYGMNFAHLSFVQFRPFLEAETSPYACLVDSLTEMQTQRSSQPGWWTAASTPARFMLRQDSPMAKRHGRCELEADAVAVDIMNRKELEVNAAGENPGLAALWEDEKARRRNNQESSFLQTQFSNDSTRVKDPEKFKSDSDRFFLSKLNAKFAEAKMTQFSDDNQPLASQALDHLEEDPTSHPTPLDDSEPLVDEMSILEVVTQSSRGRAAASEIMERTQAGDTTVMDILADLLGDGEDDADEDGGKDDDDDGARDVNDPGRRGKNIRNFENDDEDEDKETLEMTQVWVPPQLEKDGESDTESDDQNVPSG